MSKLMTLYILFDSLKKGIVTLDDKFVVSRNAYQKEGSTIYAELGTEISVQNLIRGIIVSSGNDACIIVAEALSGSEDNFANQMNFYADLHGCHHHVLHFQKSYHLNAISNDQKIQIQFVQ